MNKFNKSVSLICWAYNEEESIEEFLNQVIALMQETVEEYEIVLIDDGSTDKTLALAQNLAKKHEEIKVYPNDKNRNVGYSCKRAISLAQKEFLLWQTIDWSYDISRLREYLELTTEYDVVQGVRVSHVPVEVGPLKPIVKLWSHFGHKHLTKRSDTVSKAIVSLVNYYVIRLLFRVPLSDFQNITIYRTKWLQSLGLESNSSFLNPEMLIKSHWYGQSIKEVKIDFIARKKGEAKGTRLTSIINSIMNIIKFWFKWQFFTKKGEQRGVIERYRGEEIKL